MPILETHTAEGIVLGLDVAGAGSRFAAGLVDLLILVSGFLALLFTVLLATSADPFGLSQFVLGFVAMANVLLFAVYFVAFHHYMAGQTPGKRLLGLRVVGTGGEPPSLLQLVQRGLLWIVDVLVPVPLPIGLVVIALSPRRQRLGDMVAGTVVVRVPEDEGLREPWRRETWSELQARILDLSPGMAARFTVAELELLREVILRGGLEESARERLHDAVHRRFLARLERPLDLPVRPALKELYLFLREHRASLMPTRGGSVG